MDSRMAVALALPAVITLIAVVSAWTVTLGMKPRTRGGVLVLPAIEKSSW